MKPVVMTDDELRLFRLFRLKEIEEEYDKAKKNEIALSSSGQEDDLTKKFIKAHKDVAKSLDDLHVAEKAKLDELKVKPK